MPASISTHAADVDAAKASFDRDGYAVIPSFLTADDTRRLQEDVDRYIRDVLPKQDKAAAFYEDETDPRTLFRLDAMDRHDPTFGTWLREPRLQPLAARLLDDQVVTKGVQMFGKAPRVGNPTPAHQDGFYFSLVPNEALTIWLPLDRTDEGNGCIRYVRGSHQRGMRPHGKSEVFGFSQGLTDFGDDDRRQEVAITADPGDLIVHHSLTIHRADANGSDRRRWAVGFVYFAQRAKVDPDAYQKYLTSLNQQWTEKGKSGRRG